MKIFIYNGETTTTLLRHFSRGKEQPSMNKFVVNKKATEFKEIDIQNIREVKMKFVVKDYRSYYAIECEGLKNLCYERLAMNSIK